MDKMDIVKKERIWREAVRRENKFHRTSVNFGMNVMRCTGPAARIKFSHDPIALVAGKITSLGTEKNNLGDNWTQTFEARTIRHKEMTPQARWDVAQTTNQDIGWLLGRPALADELRQNKLDTRSCNAVPPRLHDGKFEPDAPINNIVIPRTQSAAYLDPLLKTLCPKRGAIAFHPNSTCDVTKFADTYVKDKHHSPFSVNARS